MYLLVNWTDTEKYEEITLYFIIRVSDS